jgi:hypothetical protein
METTSMNESAEAVRLEADFETSLEKIAAITQLVAEQHRGHSLELLAILRLLERLHQEVRDGFFQDALPDNRQALYALLRDIENSGGWPYIHRMKLQALLVHLLPDEEGTQNADAGSE